MASFIKVRGSQYLYRRGNSLYFRRGVPDYAREQFGGGREVQVSFGSYAIADARYRLARKIAAFAAYQHALRAGSRILSVTYEKMSGSLGSFLLVWSSVERSVREEVVRVRNSVPHGMGAILRAWESTVIERQPATSLCPALASMLCAQLQGPLQMRNGICHGLVGISAETAENPATLIWELGGEMHSISWQGLQTTLSWLSRVQRAFAIISNPSLERIGNRCVNNAENREWWRAEFGLALPND